MDTLRRTRLVLLLVLISASLAAAIGGSRESFAAPPEYTIGVVLPLSGSSSEFGQTARAAIELALDQLPPEDRARIKVVFEDDGLISSRSVSAGKKLLDIDRVDALITWSSGTALSLAGITESRKIPHIAIASDPAVSRGRRFTFTYWALPEDEAEQVYGYLMSKGKHRIGLLAVTHNGLLAIRSALEAIIAQRGGVSIVANEEVADSVLDFRSVVQRMKGKGAIDALIPMFFPGQLSVAVRQARGLGVEAEIIGFETFDNQDEIASANGALSNAVFATGADPTPEFARDFQARFPGLSLYTGSNCYDALFLLALATRGDKDPERVAGFLHGLRDFHGASGIVSATAGNRFKLPTTLKTIDASGEVRALPPR